MAFDAMRALEGSGMKIIVTGGLRYIACPSCGDLHDKEDWPPNHARPGEALVAPNVIRDTMPAIQGQHDGKVYDSKRAIRASYQPSGNADGKQYTEIGNDEARHRPMKRNPPDAKKIKDAVQHGMARLRNGEVTKETYERKVIVRPGGI